MTEPLYHNSGRYSSRLLLDGFFKILNRLCFGVNTQESRDQRILSMLGARLVCLQ